MVRRVTHDEFYEYVGELNATVTSIDGITCRTDFCLKCGQRVGYIQNVDVSNGDIGSSYYLDFVPAV